MVHGVNVETSAKEERNGALSIPNIERCLKVEGDRMKEFEEKYREVKVQTSKEKAVNTH